MDNMVLIQESSMSRVLTKHLKETCFIISACIDATDTENNKRTEDIKKDFAIMKLSYIPVGGGWVYEEVDKNNKKVLDKDGNPIKKRSMEKSFLVLPYQRTSMIKASGGKVPDEIVNDAKLFKMAKHLAYKYSQEAFLFVKKLNDEDGTTGRYYKPNGDRAGNFQFTNIRINDLDKEFFTTLRFGSAKQFTLTTKGEDKGKDKLELGTNKIQNEGIFEGLYVDKPTTLAGYRIRRTEGQIVSPFKFFDK